MKSFLAEVIEEIYQNHPDNLGDIILIVPSKRSGAFLKHELQQILTKASFAPKLFSIEEFIEEISTLKSINNVRLLFEFYEAYRSITPKEEQDDLFVFSTWAQTMIQDFNEIDRYLVDPDTLFDHLFQIKEIDQFHWASSPEKTPLQLNYLAFWKRLKELYFLLNEHLQAKGLGYQGMLYREATIQLEFYLQAHGDTPHYFIGFNALNNAESLIIEEILSTTQSKAYWDTDSFFINDKEHDAGLFLRKIRSGWKYFQGQPFNYVLDNFSKPKQIKITGIPGTVPQAKYIGELLSGLPSGSVNDIAVIMGNEQIRTPLLNAIPDQIEKVNVTGGFPLNLTPFASHFGNLIEAWTKPNDGSWNHRDVMTIITNPIVQFAFKDSGILNDITVHLQKNNLLFLKQNELLQFSKEETFTEYLNLLFPDHYKINPTALIMNCLTWTLKLKYLYGMEETRNPVFLEYLFRFYELFNQLLTYQQQYNSISSVKTLKKLFHDLMSRETVDFKGEPLEGLQLMGMLESRNLDFDTVIISSVNEGILPAGKSNNSFIPFDIKVAYGLPTYKEKDAVYTYHFYRLLQRASTIYLLYNTEVNTLDGGEKSRFIQQILARHPETHTITEMVAAPEIYPEEAVPEHISKSNTLMEALRALANRGFSPSSLSNFVRNPMDFYRQSILKINEAEAVEESIAANTMGTIVHDTLELLYKPITGRLLIAEDIQKMRADMIQILQEQFFKTYIDPSQLRGKNLISFHVCRRYVENFLDMESNRLKEGKQIRILEIETDMKVPLNVPGLDFPVVLRGKVDRVEEEDGVIRIIDYKTGKVNPSDVHIHDWNELIEDYKYSKAFQVLCYAYMRKEMVLKYPEVRGGIISFKNLSSGFMQFGLKPAPRSQKNDPAINREVLELFEEKLFELIREICDPHRNFEAKIIA
ncbi:PD-(D/E)XK nuclease family protein [Robertkochia solimangrovi]|uniref:PD-(D/E)XK nuclease family protein n=1 Tax=Robertkochia solimangrovi TaxID=2213046 RepID=UPI0011811019|nr:PD-(D/E)XK nuclease family protein [Robertkochia solimangrovi]TRZ46179.1 PD-(D/E)XK nuclease family protein [Robertkochia solimangrovi]